MPAIKQSICFGCFNRGDVTPEQVISEAAKTGFKSVEMLSREHWQKVVDAGMKIAIIGGHGSLTDGLNKPENHDRIEDELNKNIETAVEFGIPSLIGFSGNRNGLPDDEGVQICAEALKRVTAHAEAKGITICVELLNSKGLILLVVTHDPEIGSRARHSIRMEDGSISTNTGNSP